MAVDPYAELGVTPGSDATEIRAAYLRLMREHHPDRQGSAERAARLNAAYEVLGDPRRRAAHDRRHDPRRPAPAVTARAAERRAAYSEQRASVERSFSAATLRVAVLLLVLGLLLLLALTAQ